MSQFSFLLHTKNRIRQVRWFLTPLLVLVLAFAPLMPPAPGLTNAVAVDKFLNNTLPNQSPSTGGGNVTWSVVPAFPNLNFEDPLAITMHPHQETMFVASRQGLIEYFDKDPLVTTKNTFLDLTAATAVVWDGGFLGLTFHPDFGLAGSPNANYFYTYYCAKGPNGEEGPVTPVPFTCENNPNYYGSYMILSRFEVQPGTLNVIPGSEQIMIKLQLYNSTHRGGGLTFGNDGYLYLSIGEQARYTTAQNIYSNFEGGVVRIDVNEDPTTGHPPIRKMGLQVGNADEITGVGYYIPNDNPWQDATGGIFEEFWSIGHRQPHRMTLDPPTGDLWIGEIGGSSREEINIVNKGGNYGWPQYEGFLQGGSSGICNIYFMNLGPGTLTDPVVDFLRSEANAIIGGYVYRGTKFPSLYGKYLCGDYAQNRIFTIEDQGGGNYSKSVLTNFTPGGLITFGADHQGEIYMGRQAGSTTLYTLEAQGAGAPAPQFLSEIDAFSSLNPLTPAPGVIPYDMIEPFWSDGAAKFRWMAIPNDGSHDTPAEQIQFSEEGNWIFPNGSVLIKHFELGGQKLETRFEVRADNGEYYYLTYKWNAAGTDAELLNAAVDEVFTVNGQPQTWHFPSRDECFTCHQAAVGSVLGPKTRHLNKDITYPTTGLAGNQLVSLSNIGALDQAISDQDAAGFLTTTAKNDPTASLEDKARSYLDVNCSYCHQPGTGNRAVFDARLSTPLAQQNLINGAVIDELGIAGGRIVVPQQVGQSILHHRMNTTQTGVAMPPLAKDLVDAAGVQVIEDWINSLTPTPTAVLVPQGDASTLPGGCYEITPNQANQYGAAWYNQAIDLTADADISFNLLLGSDDAGADGVAFLFQTTGFNQLPGTNASRFAADGINTSLGIEFDTYDNGAMDPAEDHIAIFQDGNPNTVLAAAACATPGCADIEDGAAHYVQITWESIPQRLSVYFNGSKRVEYTGDMVTDIFGGINQVYIGFTGATGAASNQHTVCNFAIQATTPAPPPPPVTYNGDGLTGTYFDNGDLTNPMLTRVDQTIDFDWAAGAPAPGMGVETFSVRWEGAIAVPYTQTYTFYTLTDDGVRLWVDGQQLVDQWVPQSSTEHFGTIALTAGQQIPIVMEYYENFGDAVARLSWSGPLTAKSIIPQSNFFSLSTTFPVEWLSFDAQPEGEKVRLDWSTAQESDNDYFSVERSIDGLQFASIEEVPGAGTSRQAHSYRAYDDDPIPGVSYYRIRQTDLNGQFSYTRVIQVTYDGFQPQIELFPNPLSRTQALNISIKVQETQQVRFSLYNLQGQVLHTEQVQLDSPQQVIQLPLAQFPQGMYFLRITGEGSEVEQRWEVAKRVRVVR